jgi:protein phosphatase 2C family protein 2/3
VTEKHSAADEDNLYKVGSSCMQGWRPNMEDAHVHILSLGPGDPPAAYFAVFDGHGGAKTAAYCANNLHRFITGRPEYGNGRVEEALSEGFLECDRAMQEVESVKSDMSGSTAVAVLVRWPQLWCANTGDSRCVAGVAGDAWPLSNDHKPMDTKERDRIETAGGFVCCHRVNGNLAVSRSMGDFCFKQNEGLSQAEQIVTCLPDIKRATVGQDWDFVLLACDGIWDVMSSQAVVDFVTQRVGRAEQPERICEELMDLCMAPQLLRSGLGSDNMTCVLVCLLGGKPYEALAERCRRHTAA